MIRITAFFQHMPPFSGAASLRGSSIIQGIIEQFDNDELQLKVYCNLRTPENIPGALVEGLKVSEVDNSQSLTRRVFGEFKLGLTAAKKTCFDAEKPALLIISSPAYLCALVQVFFARMRKIPYVVELRDIYPQVYLASGLIQSDSLIYRVLRFLSRKMYEKAELVICATRGICDEVQREASGVNTISVYNGFPKSFLARKSRKHKRFTVCFHGILGFFQDIETLIKVSEILSQHDVDICVIGYGRKAFLFNECDIKNLRFLGKLPFVETVREIEKCHLGLCFRTNDPVSKDAFPVKVWEYLGLGIPTIITPHCEAGEFLEFHDCGVVIDSGDVEEIVNAVLRARDDELILEKMSSNCRRISKFYTREGSGTAIAKALKNIITKQ